MEEVGSVEDLDADLEVDLEVDLDANNHVD
jgi:hypothetical protein